MEYVAITNDGRAYICIAENKKQMKAARMNMRLDWIRCKDGKKELSKFGIDDITNITDVTDFKY